MTVSADKSELDGSGPSDEPDKLPKTHHPRDNVDTMVILAVTGRMRINLTYLNYLVPAIYQRKVVADVFFDAFDVFSTLIERSLKHRRDTKSNDGSPLISCIYKCRFVSESRVCYL